jgi:hypothetical protein
MSICAALLPTLARAERAQQTMYLDHSASLKLSVSSITVSLKMMCEVESGEKGDIVWRAKTNKRNVCIRGAWRHC